MLSFILRRVFVSSLLLLGASFIMYLLTAASGDPLRDLRESREPNREELIRIRSEQLNLDVPAPLRYFLWLSGAARCLIPFANACDLGVNVRNQPVTDLLPIALESTIQLLTGATLLAIIFGILIGMAIIFVIVHFLVKGRVWLTEQVLGMDGKFSRREAGRMGGEIHVAPEVGSEGYVEMEAAMQTHEAVKMRLREEAEQQAQAQVGLTH